MRTSSISAAILLINRVRPSEPGDSEPAVSSFGSLAHRAGTVALTEFVILAQIGILEQI